MDGRAHRLYCRRQMKEEEGRTHEVNPLSVPPLAEAQMRQREEEANETAVKSEPSASTRRRGDERGKESLW